MIEDIGENRFQGEDDFYIEHIRDILGHSDFSRLKDISNHGSTNLYEHSINVSIRSMRIARKLGLDFKAASRSGLLHDFYLYDWRKGEGPGLHGLRHGRISLLESQKRFELTRKEKNIILHHMWPLTPIPPSSLEGLVVSIVDKICAVEEIIKIDHSEILDSRDDLSTRGEIITKRRSHLFNNRLFSIKARIIASRFQALITG